MRSVHSGRCRNSCAGCCAHLAAVLPQPGQQAVKAVASRVMRTSAISSRLLRCCRLLACLLQHLCRQLLVADAM